MKILKSILIFLLFMCIIVGGICIICPYIPAFIYVIVLNNDDGKLDNIEKISNMVIENQEKLEDIACLMLEQGDELDVHVDVDEKETSCFQDSKIIDEELSEQENIYRLLEELYVKDMSIYKNNDVNIVVFITYSSGTVCSSYYKGFFYLPQEISESILECNYYFPYHNQIDSYGNIVNDWYYFEMSYG